MRGGGYGRLGYRAIPPGLWRLKVKNQENWPTAEAVTEALERQEGSLDNPGFCLACGEEADGCEPDARNYECGCCGEMEVYGAFEVLMMGAYRG